MKRMIDTKKFLDKLLYMGYMDEEKSEIEEVANRMTEDAYTQDEVMAMLTELKKEIDIMSDSVIDGRTVTITSWKGMQKRICDFIQSRIDKLKENN